MNNKKYHTVGTVLKYHTVRTVLKYHTVGTVLKYSRNRGKIYIHKTQIRDRSIKRRG